MHIHWHSPWPSSSALAAWPTLSSRLKQSVCSASAPWMCAVFWTWWEGEKFPQRQAWITERRCLPPTAQSRSLLCGFADFFILFYKLFSGTEERFWARGCSHRSPGFCMSCLFAFSKEASSGKARRSSLFSHRASHQLLVLNFPISGAAVHIAPFISSTSFLDVREAPTVVILCLWLLLRRRSEFTQPSA